VLNIQVVLYVPIVHTPLYKWLQLFTNLVV